jgi:hypothetical protein
VICARAGRDLGLRRQVQQCGLRSVMAVIVVVIFIEAVEV